MPEKTVKKKRKVSTTDTKLLKEIKNTNKLLKEIRTILDNTWRQIDPRKGG